MEGDFFAPPVLTDHGLNKKVELREVIALTGIYVDDYLTAGPNRLFRSFFHTSVGFVLVNLCSHPPMLAFHFGITLPCSILEDCRHERFTLPLSPGFS